MKVKESDDRIKSVIIEVKGMCVIKNKGQRNLGRRR